MSKLPIEFSWVPDATTGWGLVGMHLALGLAREGRQVFIAPNTDLSGVPLSLWPSLRAMMEPGDRTERRIFLFANGNQQFACPALTNRVAVSIAMFEDSHLGPEALARLHTFPFHIAPSRWCQGHLASRGIIAPVWLQGYDEAIFRRGPKRKRADGPFLIFSGGKLEFRKGQDITLEAFKRFRQTPEGRDAILVTAWQNKWIQTMDGIWASGYVRGVPSLRMGTLDVTSWANANGVGPDTIMDVGVLRQCEVLDVLRECDVGLFGNRCEAATNMPIVEALASGLPCIAPNATGLREDFDALDAPAPGFIALTQNGTIPKQKQYAGTDGWFEADPDEMVVRLQQVRTSPPATPPDPEGPLGWHGACRRLDALLTEMVG